MQAALDIAIGRRPIGKRGKTDQGADDGQLHFHRGFLSLVIVPQIKEFASRGSSAAFLTNVGVEMCGFGIILGERRAVWIRSGMRL